MTGINSVRATGHNNEVSGRQTPVAGQVERNNRFVKLIKHVLNTSEAGGLYNPRNRQIGQALAA
jgi:uncharacterized protein YhbP (UPF0306 family)